MKRKKHEHIIEGFESEKELLQLAFDDLDEKHQELRAAVAEIRSAILNEGKNPRRHKKIMFHHRTEWPYLWKRIDKLVETFNKLS